MSERSNGRIASLLVAASVGAVAALLVAWWTMPAGAGRPGPGPAELDFDDSRARSTDLADRLRDLDDRLSILESSERRSAPVVRSADVERVLDRLLAERGLISVEAESAQVGAAEAELDVASAVAQLVGLGPNGDTSELWQEIRRSGDVDEVVAAFERRAQENPRSADARVDLGLAYVQKILSMPEGPEKTEVGKMADQAFTAALELDPDNWNARYRKAEGLSYWPAASGKQSEAIRHFEVLVEQQFALPARPEFAKTYVLLGNLYERRGQIDKATELWNKGLALHPNDTELRDRVAAAKR